MDFCAVIVSKVIVVVPEILGVQGELHPLDRRGKGFFGAFDNIWNVFLLGNGEQFQCDLNEEDLSEEETQAGVGWRCNREEEETSNPSQTTP